MPDRDAGSDALPRLAGALASGAGESGLEAEVVAWFDQFRDRLARYLLSLGLRAPDAEELIQETFLSLFAHLRKGKPRDNLRGWLFQVAHNLALKRRQEVRRNSSGWGDRDGIEDMAVDPYPNPEEQMSGRETGRRLRAVVRALPEQDRRCLYLRAEGLRYREIAQVLDMSLGAVSVSLARSLARIARVTRG